MLPVELTPEELQLLANILESDLSDLRMEIVDTDRREYKDSLKQRKQMMIDILKKLQQAKGSAVAG